MRALLFLAACVFIIALMTALASWYILVDDSEPTVNECHGILAQAFLNQVEVQAAGGEVYVTSSEEFDCVRSELGLQQ